MIKILHSERVSGYTANIEIKSGNGMRIKMFSSTSTIDMFKAKENCLKQANVFIGRLIKHLKGENAYFDGYIKRHIEDCEITLKDAENLRKIFDRYNKNKEIVVKTRKIFKEKEYGNTN